jgi:hypothetical protein
MGLEMPRQSQLNRPIRVVGNAVQQGLLDLLPVATRHDCAVKPALDDRDARLNSPPLAIDVSEKGQLRRWIGAQHLPPKLFECHAGAYRGRDASPWRHAEPEGLMAVATRQEWQDDGDGD